MHKDLNTFSTYDSDKELFEKLGLELFKEIPNWTKIEVGVIKKYGDTIKISVEGCPAQFWTVKITWNVGEYENSKTIETGSGGLSTYWESIEMIANGLLTIE